MTSPIDIDRTYRDYAQSLNRRAYRMTGNYADADDLCSETWIRVMASAASYDSERGLWAWLVQIMRRAWWRMQNPKRANPHDVEIVAATEAHSVTVAPTQHDSAQVAQVSARVDALPAKRAAAVRRYYFEGLDTADMARIDGTSQQAASDALRRGVAELLKWWKGEKS